MNKLFVPVLLALAAACASRTASVAAGSDGADASTEAGDDDAGLSTDAATPGCNLPAPRRLPCLPTSQLSSVLPTNAYGAVEGELVAIIAPGTKAGACPNDDAHVHLQLDVNGDRIDVAVDDGQADGVMFYDEKSLPATLPAEGWSAATFDYETLLGVSSSDFTQMTPAATDAKIVADLAQVSRLTIHGQSYSDGTGVHDVHYNGGSRDGVMLLHGQGTACGDKAVALHFKSDNF